MRTPRHRSRTKKAFTLLEMTVVIMVILAMVKTGFYVSSKVNEWKLGRQASETLRLVYSAQRMYLSDNPTVDVTTLTGTLIIPYLANNATSMPTVKSLTGTNLAITVTVSPPVINAGTGTTYDPSGSSTDSLWDVGE
jgi:type II secretory pathway pseudopilin PulG